MDDHGIEPAPERSKRTSWETFLKAHWGAIAAAREGIAAFMERRKPDFDKTG